MGNLKVPESPTTYTTHYEDLKGIDCYTPNTEISNSHAADMVNMYPEGGIPIKRRGWRKIQELDSDITTAYYDAYNDKTYVATKTTIAVKGGTLDTLVTEWVVPQQITIDTNISFKLDNFYATVSTPTPADGITLLLVYVRITGVQEKEIWAEPIASALISQYFSFDANNNVVVSVADFCTMFNISESDLVNHGSVQFKVTYMPTTPLVEIAASNVKHIVPFDGKIYFIATDEIFTLESNVPTTVTYTVPITKYSLNPDGTGGQSYYSVNAMTQKQSYLFHGDGSTKKFYPHGTSFNGNGVEYIFKVTGVEIFNGVKWEPTSAYTVTEGSADYSVIDTDGSTI